MPRSSRCPSAPSGWSAAPSSRAQPNPETLKNKEQVHMLLQGKAALVTGGGRDIGRSVSIALARAGARVAINYNSGRETAEDTLKIIKAAGGDAFQNGRSEWRRRGCWYVEISVVGVSLKKKKKKMY